MNGTEKKNWGKLKLIFFSIYRNGRQFSVGFFSFTYSNHLILASLTSGKMEMSSFDYKLTYAQFPENIDCWVHNILDGNFIF